MTKQPYRHNKKYILYRKGKIFSKYTGEYIRSRSTSGYPIILIKRGKKQDTGFGMLQVRYLIAQAFVPNPGNLPCVININHIKTDCRASNLAWATRSAATIHARKRKKSCTQRKRSADMRATKSLQTRGTSHYKFKGHYSKAGALYITLADAKAATGEKIYDIKRHVANATGGWSFVAADRRSAPERSSTFTSDSAHPEASF